MKHGIIITEEHLLPSFRGTVEGTVLGTRLEYFEKGSGRYVNMQKRALARGHRFVASLTVFIDLPDPARVEVGEAYDNEIHALMVSWPLFFQPDPSNGDAWIRLNEVGRPWGSPENGEEFNPNLHIDEGTKLRLKLMRPLPVDGEYPQELYDAGSIGPAGFAYAKGMNVKVLGVDPDFRVGGLEVIPTLKSGAKTKARQAYASRIAAKQGVTAPAIPIPTGGALTQGSEVKEPA